MVPSKGVAPIGFIFMGSLTKAFKTEFMSISPSDLHHGQQGKQEGRGFTDKGRQLRKVK